MPIDSSPFLGVIIGGAFTLLGYISAGIIHYLRTKTEIEAENQRFRARIPLEKKIEALTDIHAELERCHREVDEIFNTLIDDEYDETYEDQLRECIEQFETCLFKNSVYLNNDQYDQMLKYRAVLIEKKVNLGGGRNVDFSYNTEGTDINVNYGDDEVENIPDSAIKMINHKNDVSKVYNEAKQVIKDELHGPIEGLSPSNNNIS